jgi:hypothetical protein
MPGGLHRTFGEDWSEKLASELAAQMELPAALVELAVRNGRRGAISRTVLPGPKFDLVHGNELLQARDREYDMDQRREAPGYTLNAVREALEPYAPPSQLRVRTAWEAFVGYLVFDALIANTDRHHENWAVMVSRSGPPSLAPSFDHATCLGFQLSDEDRLRMLHQEDGVERWVGRGRSSHFEGKPTLLELASDGLSMTSSATRETWWDRVSSLSMRRWKATIERVPADLMSQAERTFAFEVVRRNRERVLRACRAS